MPFISSISAWSLLLTIRTPSYSLEACPMLASASAILFLYSLSNLVNWVQRRVGLMASLRKERIIYGFTEEHYSGSHQMVIQGHVFAMTMPRTALCTV